MTVYHLLQVLLAVSTVPVVAERLRTLFFAAPIEARPVLRLLRPALEQGDLERARVLGEAARPAWLGRVMCTALDARAQGERAVAAVEELLLDLRYEATRRLGTLRALGSVASAAGMLGAVWELIIYFHGDHGLAALKAGLVEQRAFERALLSVSLGFATALVCLTTLASLRRQARRLLGDLAQAERLVEETLG